MPELTGEQVTEWFRRDPKYLARKFGQALREFGYSSITDEWVQQEMQKLVDDTEYAKGYHGGPSGFLKGWLTDGLD